MGKLSKYRFKLDLQTFNESGVEVVPEAGEQVEQPEQSEQTEQTTEKKEDVAWAKRIAAEREKIRKEADTEWQSKLEEELKKYESQYENYDIYKKAAEYLQKTSGIQDIMTLKEEIEMHELQERSEKEGLSPEALKRLDELEAKAQRLDELESQIQENKKLEEFNNQLKEFCEGKELDGKPLDHKALWNYMAENNVANFDVAFKAMKADLLETQLAEAKRIGVEEYLASKTGVKTNSGATASSIPSGGGWEGARARALARIQSLKQ